VEHHLPMQKVEKTRPSTSSGSTRPVIFSRARGYLDRALSEVGLEVELAAEDVRLAARALEKITGRVDPEDVLGRVFSTFCIGK